MAACLLRAAARHWTPQSGLSFDDFNGEFNEEKEREPRERSVPPVLPCMLTLQRQHGWHLQFSLEMDWTVCVQV